MAQLAPRDLMAKMDPMVAQENKDPLEHVE